MGCSILCDRDNEVRPRTGWIKWKWMKAENGNFKKRRWGWGLSGEICVKFTTHFRILFDLMNVTSRIIYIIKLD